MAEYKVGQTVETNDGRTGIIRYVGDIHVSTGQFLGVELSSPEGKNDGSVKGERYFDCPPMHGLFVRPTGIVRIVAQPKPAPKPAPRPSSVTRPPSVTNAANPRRTSIRPASLVRPTASPTKPPAATKSTAPTTRRSIAPTSQPPPARPLSKRLSVSSSSTAASSKPPGRTPSVSAKPNTSPQSVATITRSTRVPQEQSAQLDDLQTRLRHLQKQYDDAKAQIKDLEHSKGERDRFEAIMGKLQTKCQAYHQEVSDLKTQQKSSESELERLSRADAEAESVLELATLDREMAEERAEQAEAELESLRLRLEEKELELEIYTSERELLTEDMSDDEKRAAGYLQLQSERDRYKDALLYLKEIKEQNEHELNLRIRELETDVSKTEEFEEENKVVKEQLVTLESTIEDLRQQVDAANAGEEVIEELGEQNQQLKDQLSERDAIIRDLESLKELNDELENHHLEQANDMRAEMDALETDLAQQTQKVVEQESNLSEQELLITKFRELVLDLQSKMNDAESSKTMSDEQAKDVAGRFDEVMELNRRLRNASLNMTNKTITSELQNMKAEEASEELAIVKHYLPDSSEVHQTDSLRAYFRTKRLDRLSALSASLMDSMGLDSVKVTDWDNFLIELSRLECIHQLNRLNLKSRQFWDAMSTATLEQFNSLAPVYEDLSSSEHCLERCLDAFKRDEVGFKELSESLEHANNRLYAVAMDFEDVLASRPEDELIFRIASLKNHLQKIKSVFDVPKLAVVQKIDIEGDDYEVLGTLVRSSSDCVGAIAAAEKLIRTLETLRTDSLYPRFFDGIDDIVKQEEGLSINASLTADFAKDFIKFLVPLQDKEIEAEDLLEALNDIRDKHLNERSGPTFQSVTEKLRYWNEYGSVLMNNVEIEHGPAPWVVRAQDIQAAKKQSAEAEKLLEKVSADHHATKLQMREREEIIETKELEIETLRAKYREATHKVEGFDRLQKELNAASEEHARLKAELKHQAAEFERVRERASVSDRSELVEAHPSSPTGVANVAPEKSAPRNTETPAAMLTFIRALTDENHWLRQRENSEMLNFNLKAMFAKMRDSEVARAKEEARYKQSKADEMLAMAMALEPLELSSNSIRLEVPVPGSKGLIIPHYEGFSPVRQVRAPIVLPPMKASMAYVDLEDDSYDDLSMIADEFEMGVSIVEA